MTAVVTSVSILQPSYVFVEELQYDVVPAQITLNFDSLPSQTASDYSIIADYGSLLIPVQLTFSSLAKNISFLNNSVTLSMGVNFDSNCVVNIFYLGVQIPFTLFGRQDSTFQLPAKWVSLKL